MPILAISGKSGSGKNTVADIIQYLTSDKFKNSENDTFSTYKSMSFEKYKEGFIANSIWEQKSFAHKVKQVASVITGIPIEKFESQEFKKTMMDSMWNSYGIQRKDSQSIIMRQAKEYEPDNIWLRNGSHQVKIEMTVRTFLQKLGTDALRNNLHENVWINALMSEYREYIPCGPTPNFEGSGQAYCFPNWLVTDLRFPNEYDTLKCHNTIFIRVNRKNIQKMDHPSENSLDEHSFNHVIDNNGSIEELIAKVKRILTIENIKLGS